jgi:hypothetical protein
VNRPGKQLVIVESGAKSGSDEIRPEFSHLLRCQFVPATLSNSLRCTHSEVAGDRISTAAALYQLRSVHCDTAGVPLANSFALSREFRR